MKDEIIAILWLLAMFASGYRVGRGSREKERAKGWLDGVLYQANIEKLRHPRSADGQFKAKHQWKR